MYFGLAMFASDEAPCLTMTGYTAPARAQQRDRDQHADRQRSRRTTATRRPPTRSRGHRRLRAQQAAGRIAADHLARHRRRAEQLHRRDGVASSLGRDRRSRTRPASRRTSSGSRASDDVRAGNRERRHGPERDHGHRAVLHGQQPDRAGCRDPVDHQRRAVVHAEHHRHDRRVASAVAARSRSTA